MDGPEYVDFVDLSELFTLRVVYFTLVHVGPFRCNGRYCRVLAFAKQ